MVVITRAILVILIATLSGCAARHAALPPPSPATRPAATQPAAAQPQPPSKAELRLAQIEPIPVLPAPRATYSDPPPLEALELFARARGELLAGRRHAAIGLLERAILLDGDSYELY